MSDGDPQYDASRVMFNGAAIALVTNLVNGIKDDLMRELANVEKRSVERDGALINDVDTLEAWREQLEDARLIRQGQMSIPRAAASLALRYDKVILGIGLGLAAGVAAALGIGS